MQARLDIGHEDTALAEGWLLKCPRLMDIVALNWGKESFLPLLDHCQSKQEKVDALIPTSR